jgi:hypothetical protein
VKNEIAVNAYNTDMFILLFLNKLLEFYFFVYSSVSILPRNSFISKIETIEYNVGHVCDAFTTISVTSEGGGGGRGWVQISALILQHFLSVRV